jgi:hypothetical protein
MRQNKRRKATAKALSIDTNAIILAGIAFLLLAVTAFKILQFSH